MAFSNPLFWCHLRAEHEKRRRESGQRERERERERELWGTRGTHVCSLYSGAKASNCAFCFLFGIFRLSSLSMGLLAFLPVLG